MPKEKSFEEQLNKYFSDWAIEAGKLKKKNWEEFDYLSAINFMLADIKEDMIKFIKTGKLK